MPGSLVDHDGRPRLGDGQRIYAVGDIHGRLDLLRVMKARIEADLAATPCRNATVVFLGDYADRGPESRGVIEFLIDEPIGGCGRVCLKGNHEAMLLEFLEDPQAGAHWCMNGGEETLRSYGVSIAAVVGDPSEMTGVQTRFRRALPARHHAFLASLPLYHQAGDYLFVHAGVRPRVAIEEQSEHDLLWIRETFYRDTGAIDRFVVHGHTPVDAPLILPHRADIDTGAWFSGQLSCLALEHDAMWILVAELTAWPQ